MTITAPSVNGNSELCLFSAGVQSWNRGLKNTITWGGFFFYSFLKMAEFRGNKRSRIKMGMTFAITGVRLCSSYWCAFPKHSLQGGVDLHCKWTVHCFSTEVDRRAGARFPHPPHPSTLQPPSTEHPTTTLSSTEWPWSYWNGLMFFQADSPKQACTAGALFQQWGRAGIRVKGRGLTASTGSVVRCNLNCGFPPRKTPRLFVCSLQVFPSGTLGCGTCTKMT